jgi:glucose uptake protein GlcU
MIPKSFPNDLTNEERLFLRRWRYGVAIVYGIAALWLVGLGVLTTSAKNSVEASSSPAPNPAVEARIR